jgi:predicted nucleic acid-binding protein
LRVVLDPNVLVSAAISKAGPPRQILTAWIDDPAALLGASPDPDDDYLIALARAANADYLVSGDRHLLDLEAPDPPVLTPRQFLDLLDA